MRKLIKFLLAQLILGCFIFTQNGNSQWVQTSGPDGIISSLTANGTTIFAGVDDDGVFRSSDNGNTWTQVGLNDVGVYCLITSGTYIIAGTEDGIYRSTNNGSSWNFMGPNTEPVLDLATSPNNIYAGLDNGYGVYMSSNNGTSWIPIGMQGKNIFSLAVIGNYVFAGTEDYGLYVTSNNGQNWTLTPLDTETVECLGVSGTTIFAGSLNRICRSTNNGTSWTQVYPVGCWCFATSGNYVFAGGIGVLMTSNNGVNWVYKNQGFPSMAFISALLIANNYIFAGTPLYKVWRRSFTEIIGIKNISSEVPSSYALQQNYPNPFNPTTKIVYQVPINSFITIKIFDALGKEIETIVNQNHSPGTYEVEWNAGNNPTGIYFYKLISDNYTETRKMILLK